MSQVRKLQPPPPVITGETDRLGMSHADELPSHPGGTLPLVHIDSAHSRLLCCSGLQSPVLGESVSMYGAAGDQQNFYHDLMVTQQEVSAA